MSEPPPSNGRTSAEVDDLGDLVDHGRFVRNLAWSLLRDEDAAEEVVQETMLAAVKAQPKRDRSLRPWLATVARNVIRKRFRGTSRRRRREEVAAKPEALPGTADMVARAEMLKTVVDAVLSLDEPNRSTVLLRYYEDLPPREIAKRLGVGVETVRGRLKRAAKQLRKKLDALHPDGRAGWMPLLAGLCGMEVPASLLGSSTGATAGTEAAATEAVATQAPAAVAGGFKGVAAAFLVGAAVSGAVTWWGGTEGDGGLDPANRSSVAATDTALSTRRGSTSADDATTTLRGSADAAARLATARARNSVLKAQVLQLERTVEALKPPPPDPRAFHFALPAETPTIDAADWKDLAGHLLELAKILEAITVEIEARRGEPEAKAQRILLEHNQPLSVFAISILDELGEQDPTAAFTHPSVLANLIRAALELAGEPLSREQSVAIRTMGEAWQAEARELDGALGADAPALAATVAEVDAKLRFLRAVKNVLTNRQRSVLYQPATEGRVKVDLLSAALLHNGTCFPVGAADRASLEKAIVESLFEAAGVEGVDTNDYTWVGERWLDEIPEVLEPRYPWQVDIVFTHIDEIQRLARAQVRAIEGIVGTGRLDEGDEERLLRVRVVIQPRIRRALPVEPTPPEPQPEED